MQVPKVVNRWFGHRTFRLPVDSATKFVLTSLHGSNVSFGPETVRQLHASVKRGVGEGTGLLRCRLMALPVSSAAASEHPANV